MFLNNKQFVHMVLKVEKRTRVKKLVVEKLTKFSSIN